MFSYYYEVEIDESIDEDGPANCDSCGWTGKIKDVEEIGTCSLTPGDPSPVGRCPECDALAYVVNVEAESKQS